MLSERAPDAAPVHRAENLDVPDGIEPEPFGDAGLDQLQNSRDRGFRIVRGHEIEIAVAGWGSQLGHIALVDPMGVDDDPARRRLPEDFGEPHHRNGPRPDDVRQDLPGADRRQLVDVAHDEQRRVVRNGPQQRLHEQDVDHGGLVDDQEVAVEGVALVALEAAGLGIDFEQPMNRPGLESRRFGHPLGRAPGRGAEQHLDALDPENAQDRLDDGGLADARPSGDDERLAGQRQPDRVALAVGEREAAALLDPGDGLQRIDRWPGKLAAGDSDQPLGDGLLGAIEAGKKRAIGLADPVGDHGAFGHLEIEGGADQVRRGLEQALRERYQFLGRQPAVPFVHRLGEGERNAGPETDHRRLLEPEPHRDRVGRLEADAADVAGQAIGVLRHHLHGVRAVGLVDPHGAGRSDAVRVQKHHDLADDLLLGPGAGNSLRSNRADAVNLLQTTRLRLDRVEHLLAERPDEFLRVDGTDPADHSRTEVFLDALDRRRRGGLEKPRPELLSVGSVVDPFARRGDPLARRDRRRLPDDGHEIAMPARLGSENAEPVLFVVEGDPLDQTGQQFLRSRLRFRPHPANDRLPRRSAQALQYAIRAALSMPMGRLATFGRYPPRSPRQGPPVTRASTEPPLQLPSFAAAHRREIAAISAEEPVRLEHCPLHKRSRGIN